MKVQEEEQVAEVGGHMCSRNSESDVILASANKDTRRFLYLNDSVLL